MGVIKVCDDEGDDRRPREKEEVLRDPSRLYVSEEDVQGARYRNSLREASHAHARRGTLRSMGLALGMGHMPAPASGGDSPRDVSPVSEEDLKRYRERWGEPE